MSTSRRPVHPLVGLGREQFAVGAVEHIEKAVAVELHHDLAHLPVDLHVGQDRFPGGVVVEHVVRRELVVPGDLAGLRPAAPAAMPCRGCRRAAVAGIPRSGIAGAPIDQVKIGIVGAGDPGRAAAVQVGVARGPGVAAFLAGARNGVAAPQVRAGFRDPSRRETRECRTRRRRCR